MGMFSEIGGECREDRVSRQQRSDSYDLEDQMYMIRNMSSEQISAMAEERLLLKARLRRKVEERFDILVARGAISQIELVRRERIVDEAVDNLMARQHEW